MITKTFLLLASALPLALLYVVSNSAAAPVRVVIWDEQQDKQKEAYPNFLGNHLAEHLRAVPGVTVKSVRMDDPDQGLPAGLLDDCDVLIWWGHRRHAEVKTEQAEDIVRRIEAGKLSLIALHSAHFSTPFMLAMEARTVQDALKTLPESERARAKVEWTGPFQRKAPKAGDPTTPSAKFEKQADGSTRILLTRPSCVFPAWRNDGKPGHLRTLLPEHPIARGVPREFTLPQTEMYSDPFGVPEPDAVIFDERWDAGEHFRSGALWSVGKGKVFYFRPGHETYKIFFEAAPLKIVENAVRYLGGKVEAR